VVIAGYIGALSRLNELIRPGAVLAFGVCLAALRALRDLPSDLPTLMVGRVSLALSLSQFHRTLLEAALVYGLALIVLAWWLPRGHGAAIWVPLVLGGLAVPLVFADVLAAVCALLVAAVCLAPALAQGEDDGGSALFIGLAALGVACVALGLAMAQPAVTLEAQPHLPLARLLIFGGFGLLLGVVPGLFWQPGVSTQGHPVGVALVTGTLPAVSVVVAFRILEQDAAWLATGREAQAVAPVGVIVVIAAAALAIAQTDVRRLVGFLFVADLGYTLATLGGGLQASGAQTLVFSQLVGRALAALLVFPCLGLLSAGCKREAKPAVVLLLAYGAWVTLGGPLTPAFNARWAALQPILAGEQPWAAGLTTGFILSCLAYLVFLVRVLRHPSGEARRPARRLALLIMAGVVAVCLILWRNPGWLDAQIVRAVASPAGL
jgi:Proton-conducting membrane transporter